MCTIEIWEAFSFKYRDWDYIRQQLPGLLMRLTQGPKLESGRAERPISQYFHCNVLDLLLNVLQTMFKLLFLWDMHFLCVSIPIRFLTKVLKIKRKTNRLLMGEFFSIFIELLASRHQDLLSYSSRSAVLGQNLKLSFKHLYSSVKFVRINSTSFKRLAPSCWDEHGQPQ